MSLHEPARFFSLCPVSARQVGGVARDHCLKGGRYSGASGNQTVVAAIFELMCSIKRSTIICRRTHTLASKDLLTEICKRRLTGLTKLTRDEMRLAGYSEDTRRSGDVCQIVE